LIACPRADGSQKRNSAVTITANVLTDFMRCSSLLPACPYQRMVSYRRNQTGQTTLSGLKYPLNPIMTFGANR
jgi:hypothetical protein